MNKKQQAILKKYKKAVVPVIRRVISHKISNRYKDLMLHQAESGGKRLRPVLAMLTCEAMGKDFRQAINGAAALEILHNYSLIVDDIIDNSFFRRNLPTVWAKYGRSMAECASANYAAAIQYAVAKDKHCSQFSLILSEALKVLVEGELMDVLFERFGREEEQFVKEKRFKDISLKDYYQMIGKKTAKLFEACFEIGAISADADLKQILIAKKIGFNLGMAFQIKDDILDIFAEEKKLGKKIGKDIEERKGGNIIILLAFSELGKEKTDKIKRIMSQKKINNKEINLVCSWLKQTSSLAKSEKLAEKFADEARKRISLLPKGEKTDLLIALLDFVLQRDH